MPGPANNKARRKQVESELCGPNEYFIYQCTDKDLQRNRVAASRAKHARSESAAPGRKAAKPKAAPKAAPKTAGVPLSQVKADLKELKEIKAKAPESAARKLSDPAKEDKAQEVADGIAKSVARLHTRPRSKSVSKRLEEALSASDLRGATRSRARRLAASKSARTISNILT